MSWPPKLKGECPKCKADINTFSVVCSCELASLRAQLAEKDTDLAYQKGLVASLQKDVEHMVGQLAEAQAWKAEQLEVENSWDVQAVGRLIGVGLGEAIRPRIEPAIINLYTQLAEAQKKAEALDHLDIYLQWNVKNGLGAACLFRDKVQGYCIGLSGDAPWHPNLIDAINEAWEKVKS